MILYIDDLEDDRMNPTDDWEIVSSYNIIDTKYLICIDLYWYYIDEVSVSITSLEIDSMSL